MNQSELLPVRQRELLPLTDSLSSRVRWRVCDYEELFKAEIDLMLNAAGHGADDNRGRIAPRPVPDNLEGEHGDE